MDEKITFILDIMKAELNRRHRDYFITSITSNKDYNSTIADMKYDIKIVGFKVGDIYSFSIPSLYISMNLMQDSPMDTLTDLIYYMIVQAHNDLVRKTPELLAVGE